MTIKSWLGLNHLEFSYRCECPVSVCLIGALKDRLGGAKRSSERLSAYWGIAIIQMLSSKACLLPGSLPQGFHRREARLERPVTTGHHLRLVQGG